MSSQKESKGEERPFKPPKAPLSIKEPPAVRHFAAAPEHLVERPSVDDLRRSVTGKSWSVNEKLEGTLPPPRYPLGGVSEGLRVADTTRRIDWVRLFSIPPRNLYLVQRAIQLKLLPVESIALFPVSPGEQPRLNLETSTEQVPPE